MSFNKSEELGNQLVLMKFLRFFVPQNMLDTGGASKSLERLMPRCNHLHFLPKSNLHVIGGFQSMMNRWFENDLGNFDSIRSFTFDFPCNFADRKDKVEIFGFGGNVLKEMKQMFKHLRGLTYLELINLELDRCDGKILNRIINLRKVCK